MLRLLLQRPKGRIEKVFEQEITLVPEEGPDGQLALNHPLPSTWDLPWSAWARLNLSLAEDGSLLAINETKDSAIQLKGNVLTSAYLTENDQLNVGPLTISWKRANEEPLATFAQEVAREEVSLTPEEEAAFRQMNIQELLEEADRLLAPPAQPAPNRVEHIAATLKTKRSTWSRQRRTRLAVGGAIALFTLFGLLALLIASTQ